MTLIMGILGCALLLAMPEPTAQPPSTQPVRGEITVPQMPLDSTTVFRVERVQDANTLLLKGPKRSLSVDLVGISNPPDRAQREETVAILSRMLIGENVVLADDAEMIGPLGSRRRVYVFRAPDGLFANLELVRQGFVRVDAHPAFEHLAVFEAVQNRARTYRKGIWSEAPAARADVKRSARAAKSKRTEPQAGITVYLTRTGTKYHRSDCRWAKSSGRPVPLSEALEQGFKDCGACHPPKGED